MIAIVILLTVTACGSQAPAQSAPANTAAPAPAATEAPAPADTSASTPAESATKPDFSDVSIVFAGDAVGSSSYNIIIEMSKTLEEKAGIGNVDVPSISPGSLGAPYLFEDGTGVSLAFTYPSSAKIAREKGILGNPPVNGSYSAITTGLNNVGAVVVVRNAFLEKYNVSTVEEIIEKQLPLRIGCSPIGSNDAQCVFYLLEALNCSPEKLAEWGGGVSYGSGAENQALLADGQIDMYVDHTSYNSSTMSEIAMTQDVTFMQLADETIQWFITEQGYQINNIPAGSFKGQDKEILMPGTPDGIFCRDDLDEELVYWITKTLCENRDELVAVYSTLDAWDIELGCRPERLGGNPLHPGAARYYREMGYID